MEEAARDRDDGSCLELLFMYLKREVKMGEAVADFVSTSLEEIEGRMFKIRLVVTEEGF